MMDLTNSEGIIAALKNARLTKIQDIDLEKVIAIFNSNDCISDFGTTRLVRWEMIINRENNPSGLVEKINSDIYAVTGFPVYEVRYYPYQISSVKKEVVEREIGPAPAKGFINKILNHSKHREYMAKKKEALKKLDETINIHDLSSWPQEMDRLLTVYTFRKTELKSMAFPKDTKILCLYR